jgi:type II secretory pathway pseudopilin PulG
MRTARSFTLIELLIVMVIIVLLIALLVPGLTRARAQGIKRVCGEQLRQVVFALRMYYDENKDYLPEASYYPSIDPAPLNTHQPIFIADVLLRYAGEQPRVFRCPADQPGRTDRPPPNAGRSFFETERCSYIYYRGGVDKFVDYDYFHGAAGDERAKNHATLEAGVR